MGRLTSLTIAFTVLALGGPAVVQAGLPGESARRCAIPDGARHVSPFGSDRWPGTAARPWRTLRAAERRARPGGTVVVHAGRYNARGRSLWLRRSGRRNRPISWVAAPGKRPLIRGHIAVEGNRRRLCGLAFRGATGPVARGSADGEQVKLAIFGDHVIVRRSEVTGARWHAGVYLEGARNVRLLRNHIHRNGRFGDRSHANLDHGVYWASGSGLVAGNRIERNYAHGVQLYPAADGVVVRHNRMTGHGRAAVMLGERATDNDVVANRIWGNARGVQAYALSGRGNVVRRNLLWDNDGGDLVDLVRVRVVANRLR